MYDKPYIIDLTDAEWEILAPLIPKAKPGDHIHTVDRALCNAINKVLMASAAS